MKLCGVIGAPRSWCTVKLLKVLGCTAAQLPTLHIACTPSSSTKPFMFNSSHSGLMTFLFRV